MKQRLTKLSIIAVVVVLVVLFGVYVKTSAQARDEVDNMAADTDQNTSASPLPSKWRQLAQYGVKITAQYTGLVQSIDPNTCTPVQIPIYAHTDGYGGIISADRLYAEGEVVSKTQGLSLLVTQADEIKAKATSRPCGPVNVSLPKPTDHPISFGLSQATSKTSPKADFDRDDIGRLLEFHDTYYGTHWNNVSNQPEAHLLSQLGVAGKHDSGHITVFQDDGEMPAAPMVANNLRSGQKVTIMGYEEDNDEPWESTKTNRDLSDVVYPLIASATVGTPKHKDGLDLFRLNNISTEGTIAGALVFDSHNRIAGRVLNGQKIGGLDTIKEALAMPGKPKPAPSVLAPPPATDEAINWWPSITLVVGGVLVLLVITLFATWRASKREQRRSADKAASSTEEPAVSLDKEESSKE